MPIKQVTCCKCDTLVNKAQTYSIGKDQRACKTHEGVVEAKGEMELQRFKKTQAEIAKLKRRNDNVTKSGHPDWSGDPSTPKCWLCMNTGLRQQEFFLRLMVEREKATAIHGEFSPFDANHPGNKIQLGRCIFVLVKEKCTEALKFIREDFAMLVQMSGVVSICGQCCGTFKIDPLPKMDPKDLTKWMVIGELVKPVIKKIANTEMAKAN